jgi:hypothetical protein
VDIGAIITAVSGLLGAGGLYGLYRAKSENKKADAETRIVLSDSVLSSYDNLLADLQAEVKRTRSDYRDEINRIKSDAADARSKELECQRRLAKAERQIITLEAQVDRIQAQLLAKP